MTVDSSVNRIDHAPDGIVDEFAYDFRVDDADHLVVYADGAVVSSGYTVSDVGDDDGGNVTFTSPPSADIDALTFIREVPSTQQTAYPPLSPFPASSHEAALDKLTFLIQQLEEKVRRAMVAPVNYDSNTSLLPPEYAAGEAWIWDSVEKKIITSLLYSLGLLRPATASELLNGIASSDAFVNPGQVRSFATWVSPEAFGVFPDGTSDNYAGLVTFLTSGFGTLRLFPGKTYITSDELEIPDGVCLDLNGSTIKADPSLPSTSNIIKIDEPNVTVKNGRVDGNRANLTNTFSSGMYGCGVLVVAGGDGARIIGVETFECPTNGQGIASAGAAVNDVLFENYISHDNRWTGIGGEAQLHGSPLTNIRFINGETYQNELGGDIRIQGIDGFLIHGHNGHDGDHGAAVIGVGEAGNVCRGKISSSTFGNNNIGLPTISADAMVGGAGPYAGEIYQLEITVSNMKSIGNGGSNGVLIQNGAKLIGSDVEILNHTTGLATATGAYAGIDGLVIDTTTSYSCNINSYVRLTNCEFKKWGSTASAVAFGANAGNSIVKGYFGNKVNSTGTHDGSDDAAVLTDTTAAFIPDRFIGWYVRNTTDGSKGVITANDETTVTATLAGGTQNDWDIGDAYVIVDENGKDGVVQSGSPSGIKLQIDGFTGTGTAKGLISGAVATTWEIYSIGYRNVISLEDGVVKPAVETSKAKLFVDAADGKTKILYSDGELYVMGPVVTTTAALVDISNAINTDGRKREGVMVFNTTTNKPVWANSALAGDVWLDAAGATAHTPV